MGGAIPKPRREPTSAPIPATAPTYTMVMKATMIPNTTARLMMTSMSYKRCFRIANPIEMGMSPNEVNAVTWVIATHVGISGPVQVCWIDATIATRYITATVAAAAASHLSWSRSTPRDRRNLTTTLAAERRIERGMRRNNGSAAENTGRTAGMASGLARSGNPDWPSLSGPNVTMSRVPQRAARPSHSTLLQRGERRVPVGNLRSRTVPISPMGGAQVPAASATASGPPGNPLLRANRP